MKALSHPAALETLKNEGCSFDVSTTGEIDLLRRIGVDPRGLIHTHPIKRERDIRDSLDYGCSTFVVDNFVELTKLLPFRDRVSVLLRVGFRSVDAVVDLAKKFGCAPGESLALLRTARTMGISILGLSFHVGSQCRSPAAHVAAINGCHEIMAAARHERLPALHVLDIGGGFPISYREQSIEIEGFCAPIVDALRNVPGDIRVIAEPGRFLVGPAMRAVSTVVGKAKRSNSFWYYLDDGVYGSYSGKIYDGARYPLTFESKNGSQSLHSSTLAGPTCDSIDIIDEDILIPELEVGDLVVADSMGAYTVATAGEFNSIPKTKVVVVSDPRARAAIDQDD
jgi:ornithine decarboxylase